MTEKPALYVHRMGDRLLPEAPLDAELLRDYDAGKRLKCVLTMPRNVDRLRYYFACLGLILDNMDNAPTKATLHDAIKVRLGYTQVVNGVGGPIVLPASVAFDKMSEDDFKGYLHDFKRLLVDAIIPGINLPGFEAAALEMLGGRTA